MFSKLLFFFFVIFEVFSVSALNNGLALKPPMGWMSWERFRCITDCETYPDQCISEKLYIAMADQLVSQGFDKLGYQFVNIDDCWSEHERDANGRLVADKKRFPNGIKYLADYFHSKGLKLGIYTDIGNLTCGGYPGSYGFYETDAKTFAEWGVDSLKVDGCYMDVSRFPVLYPSLGRSLANSGRKFVYYCSWPAYIQGSANFTQIAQYCNGWRAYDDIQDSSDSLFSIIDWWAKNSEELAKAAGPGAWNDADMLIIGDFGLSFSEAQTQFGLWAMIASPMLMSNDLRKIDPKMVSILQNKEVIDVSQDQAGVQGVYLSSLSNESVQWWKRDLANGDVAVMAICSDDSVGTFFNARVAFASFWKYQVAYVRDLLNQKNLPPAHGNLTLTLAPRSSSMVRLSTKPF